MGKAIQAYEAEVLVSELVGGMRQKADVVLRDGHIAPRGYSGTRESKEFEERGLEIHIQGILAELLVGRDLNLYPDLSTSVRSGSPDLVLHNGLTIDVKYTPYAFGTLATPVKDLEEFPSRYACNLFVLVTGSIDLEKAHLAPPLQVLPTLFIQGWASRSEFICEGSKGYLKKGGPLTHILPQAKLHSWPITPAITGCFIYGMPAQEWVDFLVSGLRDRAIDLPVLSAEMVPSFSS